MTGARLWNRCAWASLIAWAVFVLLEKRATPRAGAGDYDAHARRNGHNDDDEHERELERDRERTAT